jgi:hypothetical protein
MSPESSDDTIWKFVDLTKLLHLLVTRTLHFTRMDHFEDRLEGSYPHKNKIEWELEHPNLGDFKHYCRFGCACSWYESSHESMFMWKQYGCFAIKSTKARLERSLESTSIIYNKVRYVDFVKDEADIRIPHHAFHYKSLEFSDEKEYRAEIWELPKCSGYHNGYPDPGSPENQDGFPYNGTDIPVDLSTLIDRIVLSSLLEDWKKNCFADLLEKYGVPSSVLIVSNLKQLDPIYPNFK